MPKNAAELANDLDTFAWWLNGQARALDAPVINQTGLPGYFRFNFTPFQALNRLPPDQVMDSATAALQDIGLRLVATTAPRRHLIVDHVERPSSN